jgi:hypothetical protein
MLGGHSQVRHQRGFAAAALLRGDDEGLHIRERANPLIRSSAKVYHGPARFKSR